MKGKRLFELITSLNKTEHRQLINICRQSADKRAVHLLDLLNCRNLNEKSFTRQLESTNSFFAKSYKGDSDKHLRRWIDFASKEVESLIIKNKFAQPANRLGELAKTFDLQNREELAKYYSEQAVTTAKQTGDLNTLIDIYDIQLRWLGRNQTRQNIKQIGQLLYKRKQATEHAYHKAMSYFHTVCSSLYMDNPDDPIYNHMAPDKFGFVQLRNSTDDDYSSLLYSLSETKFSFFDKTRFEQNLHALFTAIEKSTLDQKSRQYLERSSRYLRINAGLYYGYPIQSMIKDAERIFDIMLRYKIYDTVGFFFLLFFYLLEKNITKYDALLKKHRPAFFSDTNSDYLQLLEALKCYQQDNEKGALLNLQQVSYSTNLYVAAWGKLLELAIHKSNRRLYTALVTRIKRFAKLNRNRRIIYQPLTAVSNILEGKALPNEDLFEYYRLILAAAK